MNEIRKRKKKKSEKNILRNSGTLGLAKMLQGK